MIFDLVQKSPIISRMISVRLFAALKKYSFRARTSGILFILLTVIGIARAFQHFYVVDVYEPVQFNLAWHVPFNLFLWWSWLLFVPVLYWITVKLAAGRSKLLFWLTICFVLPLVVVGIRQVAASFIITRVLVGYKDFNTLVYTRLLINPWIWLDIIVYFAIVIGIQVAEYWHRSKLNERECERLQLQLVQSQLNALRSQLRPHFLFNTLNTISTLILKEDNAEAQRMLFLLHNLLKTTVFENERQEVALEEELRFVRQYLEIEKVRFKDRLEVNEDIDRETLEARVPNFLLQPIVENAIHHAIAPRASHGIIRIASKRENGRLSVSVEDNGPGMEAAGKKSKEGIGLKITKERLRYLFGNNHAFELENVSSGGLRVTMSIPLLNAGHPVPVP
jgi:two-component system LytT family sensor kinase